MPQGAKFTTEEQDKLATSMESGMSVIPKEIKLSFDDLNLMLFQSNVMNLTGKDLNIRAKKIADLESELISNKRESLPQDFQSYSQTRKHFKDANIAGVGKSSIKEIAKTAAAMTVRFVGGFVAAGLAITGAAVRAVGEVVAYVPIAGTIARHLPFSSSQGPGEYRRNCFKNIGDALMMAGLSIAGEIASKQAPALQLSASLMNEMKKIKSAPNVDYGSYMTLDSLEEGYFPPRNNPTRLRSFSNATTVDLSRERSRTNSSEDLDILISGAASGFRRAGTIVVDDRRSGITSSVNTSGKPTPKRNDGIV